MLDGILSRWIRRPQLGDAQPLNFNDLRPLPRLAIFGLVITAPYYLPFCHRTSQATSDAWSHRRVLHQRVLQIDGAKDPFWRFIHYTRHEGLLVASNPLRWAYTAMPQETTAILTVSTVVQSCGLYALARRGVARSALLGIPMAIGGYCGLVSTWASLRLAGDRQMGY